MLICTTYAWFSKNNTSNASGIAISLENANYSVDSISYYSLENNTVIEGNNKTYFIKSRQLASSFAMEEFSQVNGTDYTYATLIRLELSSNGSPYSFTLNADSGFSLNNKADFSLKATYSNGIATRLYNYISNMIDVYVVKSDFANDQITANINEVQSFVSDDGTDSKVSSIVIDQGESCDHQVLCLIIEYNHTLIQTFYSANLTATVEYPDISQWNFDDDLMFKFEGRN